MKQCEICWRSKEDFDLVEYEGKMICVRCEYKKIAYGKQ